MSFSQLLLQAPPDLSHHSITSTRAGLATSANLHTPESLQFCCSPPLVLQCNYFTACCLPHLPGLSVLENSWSLPEEKVQTWSLAGPRMHHLMFMVERQHACFTLLTTVLLQCPTFMDQNFIMQWNSNTELFYIQGQHLQENEEIPAPLLGFTYDCWNHL